MRLPSTRLAYAFAAVACACIIGFALYLQFVEEMEPCPLCWFQRLGIIGVGLAFAFAAFTAKSRRAWQWGAVAVTVMALAGASVSARHIWIQNLPADQVPACGQGIGYMLDNMPFFDVLAKALRGSGECATRHTWLGLTLPSWTMILFVLSILWAWFFALKRRRNYA